MLPIREHRSDPWSGNEDPTCGVVWPKRITIMKIEIVCLIPLCTYQRPTLAAVSLTERNLKGIFEFIENKVKRKTFSVFIKNKKLMYLCVGFNTRPPIL